MKELIGPSRSQATTLPAHEVRKAKIKPADRLDVVIVAADWGSGRRKGGSAITISQSETTRTGEYLVVGKTFKG